MCQEGFAKKKKKYQNSRWNEPWFTYSVIPQCPMQETHIGKVALLLFSQCLYQRPFMAPCSHKGCRKMRLELPSRGAQWLRYWVIGQWGNCSANFKFLDLRVTSFFFLGEHSKALEYSYKFRVLLKEMNFTNGANHHHKQYIV